MSYPQFYLQDPPILALGCLKKVSEEEASCSPNLHVSISSFDKQWPEFPSTTYLPEVVLTGEEIATTHPIPSLTSSKLDLSYDQYCTKFLSLTSLLDARFTKGVLATSATALYSDSLNPFDLLKSLPKDPNVCLFAYAVSKEKAFIGATPEILYTRSKRSITSHAVARTVSIEDPDEKLFENFSEFGIVYDFIKEGLETIASNIKVSPVHVKTLNRVKHLVAEFSGEINSEIDDRAITATLHPTPALAGFPRDRALSWIRKTEGFVRGLYGAPLGIVSKDFTKKIVAIRSALIEGSKLTAFAGSGITKESDPHQEFLEIKQKLAHWGLKL